MQLKRLLPTDEKNVFIVDGTDQRIRGQKVGDHPKEYLRVRVLEGNFLKDQAMDIMISQEVPYGQIIGFYYETDFSLNEVPLTVLVRFVRTEVGSQLRAV